MGALNDIQDGEAILASRTIHLRETGQMIGERRSVKSVNDGKISIATRRTNAVALSPDGSVFYASDGPTIDALDVQPDGTLRNFRKFAMLKGGNADSMSVDNDGRLYVGTGMAGVQVFSAKGEHLGTIPTPLGAQATAFAGPDKKTLYIVGGGAGYKVPMLAQGVQGRAK